MRVKGANDRIKLRDDEEAILRSKGVVNGRKNEKNERGTSERDSGRNSIVIFADNFFVQRWHHFASAYLLQGMPARNVQIREMHSTQKKQ